MKINIKEKKRILFFILVIFFLSVFPYAYSQTECTQKNTPNLNFDSEIEANEGEELLFDINLSASIEKEVSFSFAPINFSIKKFDFDKNTAILNFTSTRSDIGYHTLYIIATTREGCFDIQKLGIKIYDKPVIVEYSPNKKTLEINETEYIRFIINATTSLKNGLTYYEWYHNGKKMKSNSREYLLFTNFSDSGKHEVKAVVKDSRGLNKSLTWDITVKNRNRRPYVKYILPSVVITNDTEGELYNLYNYLYDPDDERLFFSVFFVDENDPNILRNESRIFNVSVNHKGGLVVSPKVNIYMKQFIRLGVHDLENLSILTDPFSIRLATNNVDFLKLQMINPNCQVEMRCNDWEKCLPEGIRIRECYDKNHCNPENNTLTEYEKCNYNATCSDKILNQDETGVDCGGSCPACPTCDDEILNQGEEQIDCGGPCSPCPSCYDGLLNQDETDLDCGGICTPCLPEKNCLSHKDCDSYICTDNLCAYPTCYDFRKNQNESGVDCGGPCIACATCNDKIKNQGEEDIDCGGPCKKCITCNDGIKNQGELFTDCGGPCNQCTIITIFLNLKTYIFILIPIAVLLIVFIAIKSIYSEDKIEYLLNLSTITNFLPKNLPENNSVIFIKTINKLQDVKQELFNLDDKEKISNDYFGIINGFYKELFEIEGTFGYGVLKASIKSKILNPFLINLFLEVYNNSTSVTPEAPLFKIELNQKVDETISILNKIQGLL